MRNKVLQEQIDKLIEMIDEEIDDDVRFTFRMPLHLVEKIDKDRKKNFGKKSRNQWIIEAICFKLDI